jgi:glycosyltransferase involved in cell wall biosynthesis
MSSFEKVSVIIPTYNEEGTIVSCIEGLINGEYPLDKLEFIISDGNSSDNTIKKIEEFSAKNPDIKIKVLNNPQKTQGYGLNIAIQNINTDNEIILRADAHSTYPQNYIADCVKSLISTNADNAGGVMVPIGKGCTQKAVSFCMSHPLGVGNAKFHLGNHSGFVDTVYLGCFKTDVFEKIGLFDPAMTPNEDAELNLRINKSGGKVYLDSNIRVVYFPRDTFAKLTKQYFRYGQGRCRTSKKHKTITSIRQAIPPFWVVLTLALLVMSLFSIFFILPLLAYFIILLLVSIKGTYKRHDAAILVSPICFATMHYSWGLGFLCELFRSPARKL